MNNFDWIVTVAVGSILGSSVLLKKVVILEVTTGLLVLLSLQYIFTLLSSRFKGFDKLMKKNPVLLYSKSGYITQNMRRERITIEEVKMNIRQKGYVDESRISAVIFEPNGQLSILPKPGEEKGIEDSDNLSAKLS
ncbi:DUF421 domain-containing protein [Alteromonas pelagimontana]|uniref:DUF421 domain-containing protein n=1 Tax=Alteromonas pelagimontana TaxID=1858656 RepID=A0A6M4MBS2_9ALTE|nr:YetF domain-containing protein [Alteromonas pelagimontana]QJR80593.1 DUF421 domain-containing protein [Alteromonas pelagimontana]